ncbi:MAG: polyribonucleotide nucleotidyltransferase [Gammaproteobacteria bacterium]|nr:polyribonucleotide nucleotidyltransferase [Gammaproteobacteria bacterium]|tara:strand:+ start:3717 stop:5810 length:2094 start_codon:yes stop_codon:yes gene_type:complete
MESYKKKLHLGDNEIILETGKVARQATGAVLATSGNTQVLATVVVGKPPGEHQDFFPLTVNYLEKTYATGKIPGGFFKREGRPTEKETLTSRLIDRPLRPLFDDDFLYEVQVICTVLSSDKDEDPDILSFIAASAALAISGLPFNGPLGAARVGFIEGKYVINPKRSELEISYLDMVIAGSDSAVIMVESEAKELSEDQMLGGILFAHQEMQGVIKAIKEMASDIGKPSFEYEPKTLDTNLVTSIQEKYLDNISKAYLIENKQERVLALATIKDDILEKMLPKGEDSEITESDLLDSLKKVEKSFVRTKLINGEPRIDGRDLDQVRQIFVEVGPLINTHGSALFTRGETQSIATVTLGSPKQAQIIDALEGEFKDQFMLHYNFPPYSVGEASFLAGPKRREIGHGKLARRALEAVLPDPEKFPYTVRVVSEITESNGSSSMATVCASSLALMDAGVPIPAAVAGVAMGLVKEKENFAVITDILGDEDHLGDMDFKVAGTSEGITALQMDIKIDGITEEIFEEALKKAAIARSHILDKMNEVLPKAREELSQKAPQALMIEIDPKKIREVIGKGGETIRSITEESKAQIDVDDSGKIAIYGETLESRDAALERIKAITAEPEVNKIYTGSVVNIMDFGAFVNIMPGKDGLVHISEISEERVEKVSDFFVEGEEVKVKVLEVDRQGKIRLTMKGLEEEI